MATGSMEEEQGVSTKVEVVHRGDCWPKRRRGLWGSGGKVAGEDSKQTKTESCEETGENLY